MMETIIGIDLGTTNSEVAVVSNGRPVIIPVDGGKMLPSVVGRDPATGALLVGHAARNQYMLHPGHTVRSVKRLMGRPEKVLLGEEAFSPEEISAIILRRLKRAAEEHLCRELHKAVITVPAYFNDVQRRATKTAGEMAGLEVVRILNEPTAAALAHGLQHHEDQVSLVYDLGGGTFDVSVVERSGDVLEVLASHGNTSLGGDDFDRIILERLSGEFHEAHGIDLSKDLRAMARLTLAAEKAKIALSDAPFAEVAEEFIAEGKDGPLNIVREIARGEFEAWIRSLVESTREAVGRALEDAKVGRERISRALLVGGSTHIPLVWRLLEEILGRLPHAEVDPALAVALGAAVQAGIIAGEPLDVILVDVAPHSLGIEVFEEREGRCYPHTFSRIIPRNTAVPIQKSEVYRTSFDDQDGADIRIYQGESDLVTRNTFLGELRFEGLTKAPAGEVRILVSFDYDASGILHVTARERGKPEAQELTVKTVVDPLSHLSRELPEEAPQPASAGAEPAGRVMAAGRLSGIIPVPEQIAVLLARARAHLTRCGTEPRGRLSEAIVALERAAASDSADVAAREEALLTLLYELD